MSVNDQPTSARSTPVQASSSRRGFLKTSGAVAASAGAFFATLDQAFAQFGFAPGVVDVGGGDFGVLNYAYALEQLESAFYSYVVDHPYRGMSRYEAEIFTGIRNNEIAHRNTLGTVLLAVRIPDLQPNFSRVNFYSRASVLATARTFEDLGVSAYNGAGQLLRNPLFLVVAGSIVSVEARQAAIVRDIISPLSTAFAGDDVVNGAGLETPVRLPSQVLPRVAPYLATHVTARQLP